MNASTVSRALPSHSVLSSISRLVEPYTPGFDVWSLVQLLDFGPDVRVACMHEGEIAVNGNALHFVRKAAVVLDEADERVDAVRKERDCAEYTVRIGDLATIWVLP